MDPVTSRTAKETPTREKAKAAGRQQPVGQQQPEVAVRQHGEAGTTARANMADFRS